MFFPEHFLEERNHTYVFLYEIIYSTLQNFVYYIILNFKSAQNVKFRMKFLDHPIAFLGVKVSGSIFGSTVLVWFG